MNKTYVPLGKCEACGQEIEVYGDPDVVTGPGEEELTSEVVPSEVRIVEHKRNGTTEICPGSHRHPVGSAVRIGAIQAVGHCCLILVSSACGEPGPLPSWAARCW